MDSVWLRLPQALWTLIFDGLDMLDRLSFLSACKLFRTIATQKQTYNLSHSLLLLPKDTNSPGARQIYNAKDRTTYQISLKELDGKRCLGSAFGYLFTGDFQAEMFLLNPLTKSRISLPPSYSFPEIPGIGGGSLTEGTTMRFVERVALSAKPSDTGDFIVMAIAGGTLAFCKPCHKEWFFLPTKEGPVDDVCYYKSKFYAATSHGALISWDLSCWNPLNGDSPELSVILPMNVLNEGRHYLAVSCQGDLLMVYRIIDRKFRNDGADGNCGKFIVVRLDEERKRWISYSLPGQSLFLGLNRAICLSATEHQEFKEHCIYFTDDFAERRSCEEEEILVVWKVANEVVNLDIRVPESYIASIRTRQNEQAQDRIINRILPLIMIVCEACIIDSICIVASIDQIRSCFRLDILIYGF